MRPENWPLALDAYLRAGSRTPFAWGSNDCLTFVTGWHQLMTGLDAFAPWRGKYESEIGAKRLIVEAGAQSMVDAGQILFGAPMANVLLARRGDVGLSSDGFFGIVTGRSTSFLGVGALVTQPTKDLEAAWSV